VNDIEADFDIYVTFSDNQLSIITEEEIEYIALFDISGNLVLKATEKEIKELEGLNKGIYIIYIDTKKGKFIRKLIKK
jgi:hypothetical protein